MSNTETDEGTLQQMSALEQETQALPLISAPMPVTDLLPAYEDNPGAFVAGIHYLADKFTMRKVRGDGNCFYRALLFSYLEALLVLLEGGEQQREVGLKEHHRMLEVIKTSKAQLVETGFNEFVFEMFYDEFIELLEKLGTPGELTAAALLDLFTGQDADGYTWYMRLLTSGYLIQHHERFTPFIMSEDSASSSSMADLKVSALLNGTQGDAAMRGYCQREVEPMGKESEQLHATALTEALGLQVSIQYLDGRPFDEAAGLGCIRLGPMDGTDKDQRPFVLHLLYRPGHYDILYSL
mmetsp:Transcript_12813/g.20900  ORF Transcript_12813/g.20900 Transcript_12813/m.20900 type:complete len:296 (+) Transcript_12813:125-1012(+)